MSKLLTLLLVIVAVGAPPAAARPIHDPPSTPPSSTSVHGPDWEPLAAGAALGAFSMVVMRRGRRSSRACPH